MSRKKHHKRRYYNQPDPVRIIVLIVILGLFGAFVKYKDQIKSYGVVLFGILLVIALVSVVIIFFLKRRQGLLNDGKSLDYEDESRIAWMLKGMPPEEFEKEVAGIFSRLGYQTEVVGHSHDGGVDVRAIKDGDLYLIQCKKYISSIVGVKEARELQGVVAAKQAKKGLLINTNKFSPEVINEFKNNPRIELVDIFGIVEYYKESFKK